MIGGEGVRIQCKDYGHLFDDKYCVEDYYINVMMCIPYWFLYCILEKVFFLSFLTFVFNLNEVYSNIFILFNNFDILV